MNILQHDFQNNPILQTSDDTVVAGKFIPKGYASATAMCKANGKLWGNYWKSQKAQSFANAVTASVMRNGISVESVIIIQGGEDPTVQGTWVHPKVAMHLAMWISDDFALWATEVLLRVVNGEFKPLTEEAELAAQKLNKLWDEIRKHGKEARRELTDAIAAYIKRHPYLDDSYVEEIWWKATNKMYYVVFGVNAVELEKILGCDRHESRDCLDRKCLMAIDRAESDICDLIDNRDIEPCLAVTKYQEFFGITPMFPSKKLNLDDLN
jgi:KilA-N domain